MRWPNGERRPASTPLNMSDALRTPSAASSPAVSTPGGGEYQATSNGPGRAPSAVTGACWAAGRGDGADATGEAAAEGAAGGTDGFGAAGADAVGELAGGVGASGWLICRVASIGGLRVRVAYGRQSRGTGSCEHPLRIPYLG